MGVKALGSGLAFLSAFEHRLSSIWPMGSRFLFRLALFPFSFGDPSVSLIGCVFLLRILSVSGDCGGVGKDAMLCESMWPENTENISLKTIASCYDVQTSNWFWVVKTNSLMTIVLTPEQQQSIVTLML